MCVAGSHAFRHQECERVAQHFAGSVSEQLLASTVDRQQHAGAVDRHDRVRCAFGKDTVELCVVQGTSSHERMGLRPEDYVISWIQCGNDQVV